MIIYVNISDEILEWLCGQSASFPEDVCEKLQAWRSGKKKPTFSQIEEMSKKTGIPLGYFFLTHPPAENRKLLNFRTINSLELKNPGRNLLNTIHLMEMVQEWLRDRLIYEDAPQVSFVGSFRNVSYSDIYDFAASVRKILGIADDWFRKCRSSDDSFRTIRNAMSNAGVFVMMNGKYGNNTKRPFDIEEFRAFALTDDYAPLIFINSRDSSNGRLFSLLHEFAHICIGESSLYNDRWERNSKVTKTETICNALAAEILVPKDLFLKEWLSGSGQMSDLVTENDPENAAISQKIDETAKKFRSSSSVIARRSLDEGFISRSLYEKIIQDAADAYRSSQEKPSGVRNYYTNLKSYNDRRFLKMLSESVSEGTTSYTDAFHLTNTNRHTFGNLIRESHKSLESDRQ